MKIKLIPFLTGVILSLSILFAACKKNTSLQNPSESETANWMNNTIKKYPGISLFDICVPGSHDAGTYLLSECVGGNECNTQTQFKNITEQLNAGLRIFDIRPVFYNGRFYTQHATGCDGLGCKGDQLTNMFSQVNSFIATHDELVILELSHFCHTSYNDSAFQTLIMNTFGDQLYKEPTIESTLFIHKKLNDIIPSTSKKGKVMIIYDDGVIDNPANRAQGIFTGVMLPTEGYWTNSHDLNDLELKQADNYKNYSNSGNTIFQFSWQITQSDQMAVQCVLTPDTASIGKLATRANLQLDPFLDTLMAHGEITKGRIPNVIFVDFADEFITKTCMRLNDLNLQ